MNQEPNSTEEVGNRYKKNDYGKYLLSISASRYVFRSHEVGQNGSDYN